MAQKEINLGVIGLSQGNGHPYSWSSIINGYNFDEMAKCPFPVIPEYLSKQKWPDDQIKGANVTHIWTQDPKISLDISKAAKIPEIVDDLWDMIGSVDAVLLARDDGENHLEMALPFIEAGLPIFIDKPLALDIGSARQLFDAQVREGQLFTCSSLRYAKELYLTDADKTTLGEVKYIEAEIAKSWDKYAIHIIEPIVAGNKHRGKLVDLNVVKINDIVNTYVKWDHLGARISCYNNFIVPIQLRNFGTHSFISKTFNDTFSAFKASLEKFLESILAPKQIIPMNETMEIIEIIERGRNA